MFGLEKKPKARFEFDLEKDLKNDPHKLAELIKTVEGKVNDVKQVLRQGGTSSSFDQFGILLHGYAALQRVLNRMNRK
ncbi:MAG: DUF5398 family protein [Chlamydiota bacterium]